jgi:hypothetical protein
VARIVFGSYMVRYPLGGLLSSSLQWLVGFQRAGHDLYFVEKSGWANSCYDPSRDVMSDDCSYGTRTLNDLFARFGLENRWCFVDAAGCYHGLSRQRVESVFRDADVFVDRGTHGAWLDEAAHSGLRIYMDAEPGMRQMRMENSLAAGRTLPDYDFYFSTGRNVGTDRSSAPTAGKVWRPITHPVVVELFSPGAISSSAAFTTVMNWQSYEPIEFRGESFGHKDVEFEKFIDLPRRVGVPMEVAVGGKKVPLERLRTAGWRVLDAHKVTASVDSYWKYLSCSLGEFTVCKSGFVKTNNGWFSDRASAYLASGRPVVQQDTGFGDHLPCGDGLMAVRTVEEASAAIEEIIGNYEHHSRRAREIAVEHLEASRVLGRFLRDIGVE